MAVHSFPTDHSDLEGPEERKLQYITALVEIAGEDAKHVNMYVTVSLTSILVTLTQLPFSKLLGLPLALRIILVLGVGIALSGAALFFRYVQAIHRARMALVRCLASANARHARELWAGSAGVWKYHSGEYIWGLRLTVAGQGIMACVVAYLLLAG
ncbi:hypothetical protein [Streptomyces camponoticapitis]|uniref:hypothetical protein n=1 Tax=Streptomyces camponoticapitis TaxID=1616125 RepID=UPI001665BB35|nr:hypothetical protein [Streptomyces camponoticapitis]